MNRFVIGNLFLLLSMACAATSQILLRALLAETGPLGLDWTACRSLLTGERLVRGGLAMMLIVAGFGFWVLALSRLQLSYAYPIACSSILLVTLLSALFLGEAITVRTWAGTVLILLGVVLLMPRG